MSKERYLAEAFLGFVVALLATHLFKKLIAFRLVVNIGLVEIDEAHRQGPDPNSFPIHAPGRSRSRDRLATTAQARMTSEMGFALALAGS
jgi:hypothetical protein